LIKKELFDRTSTILTLLGGYNTILSIISPSIIILVIITSATAAGAVEVAAVKTAVKVIIILLLKIIAIIIEAKIIKIKTINPIN
jgi:membrane protein implicated in regulation of membrane protease activity